MPGYDVQFPTYDGLKLAGTVYSAGEKRPCIIMTHGVSPCHYDFFEAVYNIR